MLYQLAEKIAAGLIAKGADPENKEVLVYGMECILSEIIVNAIIFTFAFLIGRPLEMLIWNLFMLPLRVNIGGHHAKTPSRCILFSVVLAAACVLVYPLLQGWYFLLCIEIILSCVIAFFFAPHVHESHPISEAHRAKIRGWGKRAAIIESVFIALFVIFQQNEFAQIAGLGMLSAVLLFFAAKIDAALAARGSGL